MEHRRFDQWTKSLAAGGTRRTALRLLGGSALATGLARLGLSPAAGEPIGSEDDKDANCRGTCAQCDRGGQCCSGRCDGGACRCKPRGSCSHDRACCSGRCGGDGRCQRAPDPGCGCNLSGTCGTGLADCGTGDCFCSTAAEGGSVCVDNYSCTTARTCNRSANCRRGEVCATRQCCPTGGAAGVCASACGAGTTAVEAAEPGPTGRGG
jgi:hypothetical protein